MVELRPAKERGYANHGWLESWHSFSFADYHDPDHMGFGPLRVINDDVVEPGRGFGTHPHRDMEIITYILDGALEHKDSMGNGSVIRPGDVQRMSAGRGVMHSEFNPSREDPVHLLQIWIEPSKHGVTPSYEEKHFTVADRTGRLRLVASPDGAAGSVTIHQDARVYAVLMDGVDTIEHPLGPGRRAYVHVARGRVSVNGSPLRGGDAVKVSAAASIRLEGAEAAEVLLFDLP